MQGKRLRQVGVLLVVILVAAFLAWGLMRAFEPQKLPLEAQIEATEVNVASKVPARVGRVLVREGDTVKAGDILFELNSPEVEAKVAQAKAAEAAAQALAAKADAGARPEEITMARENWERARAGAWIARTTYQRVNAMAEEGVLARQKRDEAYAQWRAAEDQASAARAQYDMARRGARPEDKEAAQAQARQVAGVLQEAEAAQAELRMHAPIGGEVSQVQIQAGEIAPQGFPVVTLVKLDDAYAVLHVREDAMQAFRMGTRHTGHLPALQRDMAFTVSEVSVLSDFATWRAAKPGGTDLRTFEIRLRPAPGTHGLRPGMTVVFPPA